MQPILPASQDWFFKPESFHEPGWDTPQPGLGQGAVLQSPLGLHAHGGQKSHFLTLVPTSRD